MGRKSRNVLWKIGMVIDKLPQDDELEFLQSEESSRPWREQTMRAAVNNVAADIAKRKAKKQLTFHHAKQTKTFNHGLKMPKISSKPKTQDNDSAHEGAGVVCRRRRGELRRAIMTM